VGNHEKGVDLIGLRISLQALRRNVLAEAILALLVLAAVAFLGTLEPPVAG
jgi:putative copper export protein